MLILLELQEQNGTGALNIFIILVARCIRIRNIIYTTSNVRLIYLPKTTNSSFLSPNIRTLLLSTAILQVVARCIRIKNIFYTTSNVSLIHLPETTNSSFLPPNIRTLLLSTAYYKWWQDVSELELLFILQVMSVLYICLKPPTPPFFHQISGPSYYQLHITSSGKMYQNQKHFLYYKQCQTYTVGQNSQLLLSSIKYQDPPTVDCILQEMSVFYSQQD